MIVGSMVVKNEIDRYLEASLTRLLECCDKVFVADDQSNDGTAELAKQMGCTVWVRDSKTPSFREHEGQFRQAAWTKMGTALKLRRSDWVLSVDADEYFLGSRDKLKELSQQADSRNSFSVPVFEVWETEPDIQIRVDGFWRNNHARRIGRYTRELTFRDQAMASGSTPYKTGPSTQLSEHMGILHFGYADPDYRKVKYDFYKSLSNHGHYEGHIESIIKKPKLEHYYVPDIDFWMGVR